MDLFGNEYEIIDNQQCMGENISPFLVSLQFEKTPTIPRCWCFFVKIVNRKSKIVNIYYLCKVNFKIQNYVKRC